MRRALLLLGMLALAAPAVALMVEVPLPRLVADADAVVKAKVVALESRWTDDHATIVTDVTLTVEESWAGDLAAGRRFVVRVEGGEVGDMGIQSEHQPAFADGEECVLLLRATSSARLEVSGLEQGKFTVLGDQVVDFRQQAMPLQSLRRTVESLKPARSR